VTERRKSSPPADLGARGRAFWRSTLSVYELSGVELELLRECCRLMDECELLRSEIVVEGVTVAGSTGQRRVNPAIGELRSHRLALSRLLAQLALPDEIDEQLRSPASARGRKAASVRWSRQSQKAMRRRGP
jgi:hypothetical protein